MGCGGNLLALSLTEFAFDISAGNCVPCDKSLHV